MNLRHCALTSLAAAAIALPLEGSMASTCKDELNRFESRLYDSSIPSTDPQLFQELVREAERAAELRDEQQCLQRVAELSEALPERAVQPGTPGSRAAAEEDKADTPARPKAPILLVTGDGDGSQPAADDEDDDTD